MAFSRLAVVKCGVKNVSSHVEKCLSLSVEERMRRLIRNMVRMSKQRIDLEKSGHRTEVTSDVRRQLMAMNQQAKSEWAKEQAEGEKLWRVNEEPNKAEEDAEMRRTAANVAVRASVGGDDMLSKWKLMAEQARQNRDPALSFQSASDGSYEIQILAGRKNNQDGQTNSGGRKFGRENGAATAQLREDRTLSIKDLIAVMEREHQPSSYMSSCKLNEKIRRLCHPSDIKELSDDVSCEFKEIITYRIIK